MAGDSVTYLLDTNVFVEAARRYYPLDFARPFWDGLVLYGSLGQIASCDRVLAELKEGDDDLKDWAMEDFQPYFSSTKTQEVLTAYAELVQWAATQDQYKKGARDEFMTETNADTWLLALAMTTGAVVVTHEVHAPDARKKIPIPNVCEAFEIGYCDTFQMLRDLKFAF